jgi:O-antigen/teichoic acid export membrane protein
VSPMHANIGALPERTAPREKKPERLISIAYLLLRATTAGGAFIMGFVQTFVFARVLTPDRFSIFIVVGGIGYSLWVTDLGLAKVLFVNLREPYLAGKTDRQAARQATSVIVFYVALAIAAAAICFAIEFALPAATARSAAELALFMLYITLNLAWFSLRTLSIAVDLFLFFEKLELVRRVLNVGTMLAMLAGLPLTVFLVGSNILWGALFAVASVKLVRRGAMVPELRGIPGALVGFFREHWHAIGRSGTAALSGVFIATFPYYFVPAMFGLGAAPIILEVTFRIFRGSCVIFAAICDLAIPGQTRAFAARDVDRLVRTTLLAIGLCCVPAASACALLLFAGGPLFAFLLHGAATVPPGIVPILVVLILTSILQIVCEALLQYSGFFRSLAFNGAGVVVGMIVAAAIAVFAKLDIVGFLAAYTAVYTVGAVCLTVAAVWGPVHAAKADASQNAFAGLFKWRSLRPAPSAR